MKKHNLKKVGAAVFASATALALAAGLAGCGGNQSSTEQKSEATATYIARLLKPLGVRVTLSYILVYCFGFGHRVIWRCIPIGWICALLLSYGRFRSGIWKKKAIVGGSDSE